MTCAAPFWRVIFSFPRDTALYYINEVERENFEVLPRQSVCRKKKKKWKGKGFNAVKQPVTIARLTYYWGSLWLTVLGLGMQNHVIPDLE